MGVLVPSSTDRIRSRIPKIFIRPAQHSDLEQLCRMHSYYIENTVYMPETRRLAEEEVEKRMMDTLNAKLPFIVAIPNASPPAIAVAARRRHGPMRERKDSKSLGAERPRC